MKRAWVIGAIAAAATSPAHAGQLHIQHYGLAEVRQRGETVLVGDVVSSQGKDRDQAVTITVVRVFGPGPEAVGSAATRKLYAGVEWTNPHVSPIDDRLRDGLPAVPKTGTRVLLVPAPRGGAELAAATPARLRALEILWAPDPPARLAGEPLAALQGDLRDLDLAPLVATELERRGALTPPVLLRAEREFVDARFRALDPAARAAFVAAVLPETRRDRALRQAAARIALASLAAPAVKPTAELIAQLDRRDAEEARLFDDTRTALMTLIERDPAADLSPFADYLAESTIHRPDYRDQDEWLPKQLQRCDRAARARVAAQLLGAVYTSRRARRDDGDRFILHTAVELSRDAPSEALWEPLRALDPRKSRVTSSKEDVLAAMVEIGVALARHDPRYRDRVRDLVEPHLDERLRLPHAVEALYREHIGALPAGAPAPATLDLRPGMTGRLASGERVSVRKEADGLVVELATPGGGSEERTIPTAGDDGYREWWVPPYVVIVKRTGSGAKLRFTPAPEDPALEPADAYEMARAICDKRGATQTDDQDPRDYDGVYVYRASASATAAAQPCRVVIGLRTRKVLP